MGVKQLWTLLAPVGRPVLLETMEGKSLAIDSSIWIYQFQATMRDKEGRGLTNAHLLGFLRRICKLLFYGIKPVFVFDGGAPTLKRSTTMERKRRKAGAAFSHAKVAERLLAAQLRREAVTHAKKRQSASKRESAGNEPTSRSGRRLNENTVYLEDVVPSMAPSPKKRQTEDTKTPALKTQPSALEFPKKHEWKDHDPYKLPDVDLRAKVAEATRLDDERGDRHVIDPRLASEDELRHFIETMRPEDFDASSPAFRELPTEVQYEIIGDLRLKSRQTSHARLQKMLKSSKTALDFSRAQIRGLHARNRLTQQLLLTTNSMGTPVDHHIMIPVRIAAERDKEYVLMKRDGPEGGWSLGIRDEGTKEKPIVVKEGSDSDDSDMEDVFVNEPPLSYSGTLGNQRMPLASIGKASSGTPIKSTAPPVEIEQPVKQEPLFALDIDSDHIDDDFEPGVDIAIEESLEEQEARDLQAALAESRRDPQSDFSLQTPGKYPSGSTAREGTPVYDEEDEEDEFEEVFQWDSTAGVDTPQNPTLAVGTTRVAHSGKKLEEAVPLVSKRGVTPVELLSTSTTSQTGNDISGFFLDTPPHRIESLTKGTLRHDSDAHQKANGSPPAFSEVEEGSGRIRTSPVALSHSSSALISPGSIEIQKKATNEEDSDGDDMEGVLDEKPSTSMRALPLPQRGSQEMLSRQVLVPTSTIPDINRSLKSASKGQAWDEKGVEMENPIATPEAARVFQDAIQQSSFIVHPDEIDNDNKDEDEAFSGWSRSPSPTHKERNEGKREELGRQEDTDNKEAWDAADEVDVEQEEDAFVDFVSQVKGKDLESVRNEIEQEIQELNKAKKAHQRDSEEVTQHMVGQIMMLLRLFGIPYITAPMEAEAQCAELLALGLVEGVITDDSDVFLFGATRVFKNMFNQSKTVECFLASDLQRELSLDREKLIALAYLLGSDYVEGLEGVGPVVAMELLAEFDKDGASMDTLRGFKDWWTKVQNGRDNEDESRSNFRKRFKRKFKKLHLSNDWPNPAVRDAYLRPTVDESEERFKWGLPDLDGLRTFLGEELRWSQTKIDDLLLPIIRKMGQRSRNATANRQSTLPGYFDVSGGFGSATVAPRKQQPYASKRLQKVVSEYRKSKDQRRIMATTSDMEVDQSLDEGETVSKKAFTTSGTKQKTVSKRSGSGAFKPAKKKRKVEEPSASEGDEETAGSTIPDRPLGISLRARRSKAAPVIEDREGSDD